jgi:hypothetical protein
MNKHLGFALFAILIALPISVSALVTCRDTDKGCSFEQLIDLNSKSVALGMAKEERIAIMQEIIAKLTEQLAALKADTGGNLGFDFQMNCKVIKNDLLLGKTDAETNNEVTLLQRFLISVGYLKSPGPTGYYGPLTADAVYRYQKEFLKWNWATIKSGVGPKTREAIAPGLLRIQDTRCWN